MDQQVAAAPRGERHREDPGGPRCPRCGTGDLLVTAVARHGGGVWSGAYCAGLYDRERRRYLRPSCGYSGECSDSVVSVSRTPVPQT